VQNTYVQCFAPRHWVKSLDHIHICVLGCALHIRWCLAWLGSASVATIWGWKLAGIKEWFGLRVAASNVQLWECTIFLWMTKPIYFFRALLPLWLGGRVDLHNCHLRCCTISNAVVMWLRLGPVFLNAVGVQFPLRSPGRSLGFCEKVSHHLEHLAGAVCCYHGTRRSCGAEDGRCLQQLLNW
jgi:hypothetical protein